MRMPRDPLYLLGAAATAIGFLGAVWFEIDFHPRRAIAMVLVLIVGVALARISVLRSGAH